MTVKHTYKEEVTFEKYIGKIWASIEKTKEISETKTTEEVGEMTKEREDLQTPEGWERLANKTLLLDGDKIYNFAAKKFWDLNQYSLFEIGEPLIPNVHAIRKLQEITKKPTKKKELTQSEFLDKMKGMV